MSNYLWYPHALVPPTGNAITQVDSLPLDPQLSTYMLKSASAYLPALTGSHSVDPVIQFSTTQIKDWLDYMSTDDIAAGATSSNFDIEYRRAGSLGTRDASASLVHMRSRATETLATWESLDAGQDDLATINGRVHMVSDGTNAPVTVSTSVALGATSAVQHAFTLGSTSVTTSTLSGDLAVTRVRWQNNLRYRTLKADGTGWTVLAVVDEANPTLTITTEDLEQTLVLLSAGESISALTFYLRKKVLGGINVADGTAEHIKITASAGTAVPTGPREIQIQVHSFAVDTASAIT